tara:strand:+ start:123 stop:470 length:348 start_codon:yes stop_codon:yes gene_type:complete
MTKQTKQTTFEAPEGFNEMAPKAQANAVAAWVAANPKATIQPTAIGEGGLPAYLRSDSGKRADINRMLASPIAVAKFIPEARKLGGGYTDLVAALTGGYSRSAAGYGNAVVKLTA